MAAQRPAGTPRWCTASGRHLGSTQQQLAETLGTRQQTISEWETGMYRPRDASVTILNIIAERAEFVFQADSKVNDSERPT